MTHSIPREFIITFKDVSPAEGNQLAEELRVLLLRACSISLEVDKIFKQRLTKVSQEVNLSYP